MKKNILNLIILLFFNSCLSQNHLENLILDYQASTRGTSVKITVESKKLTHTNFEGEKIHVLSDNNWKEIQNLVKTIDLNSINDLKAPSTKSHTDAALIASIKIIKSEKVYESSTFDHGNPPKELKELIDKLFEIAELN